MRSIAAAVGVLAWGLAQAAPPAPVQFAPAPPPPDLRQTLQQLRRETTPPPAPRQLTPAERAELRRQLSEFAQPAPQPRRR